MFQAKIFTLYPEYFPGPFEIGICKKAFEKKLWDLKLINIRDYADDKHKTVDDTPYGGGVGMLMRPDVVAKSLGSANPHNVLKACINGLKSQNSPKILSAIRGKKISDIVLNREAK